LCNKALNALHRGEQLRHFLAAQHDRHTNRCLRTTDVLHPGQIYANDVPVEEQQRCECLFVS
jgi:hypothetical protein